MSRARIQQVFKPLEASSTGENVVSVLASIYSWTIFPCPHNVKNQGAWTNTDIIMLGIERVFNGYETTVYLRIFTLDTA